MDRQTFGTGRSQTRTAEILQYQLLDLPVMLRPGSREIRTGGTYSQNCMMEILETLSRNLHLGKSPVGSVDFHSVLESQFPDRSMR